MISNRFYFGRLNLLTAERDKKALLWNAFCSDEVLKVRLHEWGFWEIEKYGQEQQLYYTGYLLKYKPITDQEIADRKTHKLSHEEIQNAVIAKSRFIIHVKSGIIAYHPVSNEINRETFCSRFARLFETTCGDFFITAEIQSIEERAIFYEAIKRLENIKKLSISLHPSNPRSSKIWKITDERLKIIAVGNYREYYEADPKKKGLNMLEDNEIKSKITMAGDGYGLAKVVGVEKGEEKIVSTSDNPISVAISPIDDKVETLMECLKRPFKNIIKRIKNED